MTVTITANVVAWYAAVVATAAFGVNAYSAWSDRARFVVSAYSGYQVTPGPHPYQSDATYIAITVSNPGWRPATVEKVWLTVKGKKGGLLAHDSLIGSPRKLEEGTSTRYMINQSGLAPTPAFGSTAPGQSDVPSLRAYAASLRSGVT